MGKHTPGPWELREGQWADRSEDGGGGFHILMGESSGPLGGTLVHRMLQYGEDIYPESKSYAETEANARLIAAAPEMLEALIEARDTLKRTGIAKTVRERLDAAISKATA